MRLFIAGLVAFVCALPAPAVGQAARAAELAGTWVLPHDGWEWADSLKGRLVLEVLTLNADGSYSSVMKKQDGDSLVNAWTPSEPKSKDEQYWEVTGDTLWFRKNPPDPNTYDPTFVFQRQNQRLLLWAQELWEADEGRRDARCAQSWERFDPSKARLLPPRPQITLRPADLVGTWAGTVKTKRWGTVTDTLVIGADHSLRAVHYGPYDTANEKSNWAVMPGDYLTGRLGNIDHVKVVLHDGMLVRCLENYAVLRRVAP